MVYINIPTEITEKFFQKLNPNYPRQIGHQNIFPLEHIFKLFDNCSLKIINIEESHFFDVIYWTYFFLNNANIINENGDTDLSSKNAKYLNNITNYLYYNQPLPDVFINGFSSMNIEDIKYYLNLISLFGNIFFPKTYSFILKKSSNSNNFKNFKIFLKKSNIENIKAITKLTNKYIVTNKSILNKELNKELQQKNQAVISLTHKLDIIRSSKFFRLWPLYLKIKKIFLRK